MNPITGNPVFLFLKETFTRLITKSPLFFRIWNLILGILIFITGLPTFLVYFDISIPSEWKLLMDKHVARAAIAVLLMSMLSAQSKTVAVTKEGEAVKQTNPDLLPFTAQIENKKAADKPVIDHQVIAKVDEVPKQDL